MYDKSPSLMWEHQEATMALEQQSLRKAAVKDRSKRAAAKWQGAKPLGRKSIEAARAEWDSHVRGGGGGAALRAGGPGGLGAAPRPSRGRAGAPNKRAAG